MQHDRNALEEIYEGTLGEALHNALRAIRTAERYHEHLISRSELNYVNVTSPGMTHYINLFIGDHCIALVDNAEAVEKLTALIPERQRPTIKE